MKLFCVLSAALFVFFSGASFARADIEPAKSAGHFVRGTFHTKTISYPYSIYLPENIDPSESLPVILFLHGAGESGTDGVLPTKVGIGPALLKFPQRYRAIVVMPQTQRKYSWDPAASKAAMKIAEHAITTYNGDRSRVYLTGVSLGAWASWRLAAKYPHAFAGLVPVSSGWESRAAAIAVRHIPIWAFANDFDIIAPAFLAGNMIKATREAGNRDAHITHYPSFSHDSWDRAYAEPKLPSFLFSHVNPHPPANLLQSE
ncbi:MAG: carboxylesterase family protein [Bdellovibrionota bacterium]